MAPTKYKKIPLGASFHLRYLSQDLGVELPDLCAKYPQFARTSIYRHSRKPFDDMNVDKRKLNKGGRPKKLNKRDDRKIVSTLLKLRESFGTFCSTDVQREAGIKEGNVSNRTVRRSLRKKGYRFTQCRKKGLLYKDDLVTRLKFAKRCKRLPQKFWEEGVSFYLDGTSWVYKTNPCEQSKTSRTRMWRKPGEHLDRQCTAKGKKEGTGGKTAKFMVAIAHGRGVIKCHPYTGNVCGELCAEFIKNHFTDMFERSPNPRGKLFFARCLPISKQ